MKHLKLILGAYIVGLMSLMCFAPNVFAATKEIETEITEDYASAKFTIEFDEKGEYDITLTSPNSQVYDVPSDDMRIYEYTVQDFAKGKWVIKISNSSGVSSDHDGDSGNTGTLEETDGSSDEETDDAPEEATADVIGHAKITVNGSRQALIDTNNADIVVAEEITGYKAYFKNNILHVEWDDSSVGNVQVTVTDQKTQEMIDSQSIQNMVYEYEIDSEKHPYVIVTVVPAVSAGKSGAEKSYTYPTVNEPDATVEFEDIAITNKDAIKGYVNLDDKYRVVTESLENGVMNDYGILEPGNHEIDLNLDIVGENNLLIWVIDPKTNYMKSWEHTVEKDVTAPVLKLASSYESYTTEADMHVFEGSIDDTYDTFTINGTDIKVEGDHTFRYEYSLKEGENNITILAMDKAGNVSEFNTVITRVIPEEKPIPWMFIVFVAIALIGIVGAIFRIKKLRALEGEGEKPASTIKNVPKKKSEKNKVGEKSTSKRIFDVLDIVLPVLFVVIMVNFVVGLTTVESASMEPKLVTGTSAIFNRLAYINHEVQRGDIVCIYSDELHEYLSKRVIGIPGDEIMFRDGDVYINKTRCDESAYLTPDIETNCTEVFNVPEGCVFVMGDNREYSYDSRFFKNPYLPQDNILGKYIGSFPLSRYYLERLVNPSLGSR